MPEEMKKSRLALDAVFVEPAVRGGSFTHPPCYFFQFQS
jgi:hypothetical protein